MKKKYGSISEIVGFYKKEKGGVVGLLSSSEINCSFYRLEHYSLSYRKTLYIIYVL